MTFTESPREWLGVSGMRLTKTWCCHAVVGIVGSRFGGAGETVRDTFLEEFQ